MARTHILYSEADSKSSEFLCRQKREGYIAFREFKNNKSKSDFITAMH
jgi:hypothetical protein